MYVHDGVFIDHNMIVSYYVFDQDLYVAICHSYVHNYICTYLYMYNMCSYNY